MSFENNLFDIKVFYLNFSNFFMQRIDLIFINLTISIFFYMQPKVQQQKRKKGQAKPEYKNLNAFKGQ